MSSVIEFPLTSPCPAHRDAILSWVVEGSESPAAAAAAEHVKKCVGCRGFRDSLKTQQALVKTTSSILDTNSQSIEPRADFKEWLVEELRGRSERQVARSVWRSANYLFLLDPIASQGMHDDGTPKVSKDGEPTNELRRIARELSGYQANRQDFNRDSCKSLALAERTVTAILNGNRLSKGSSRKVIQVLLDAADSICDSYRTPTTTLRAFDDWYHGNGSKVQELLERALATATTSLQRGHALANTALLRSSQGQFEPAIELARQAVMVCNNLIFPRANLVVWLTTIGDYHGSERVLDDLIVRIGASKFRQKFPWTQVQNWLTSSLELNSASTQEANRALAFLSRKYLDEVPSDSDSDDLKRRTSFAVGRHQNDK
jgi:hypothetical protein